MLSRLSRAAIVAAVGALIGAAPALASLPTEIHAGRAIAQQLLAHDVSCTALGSAEFRHLGEYMMNGMLGSTAQHEAMNARMAAMLGATSATRMHALMGRRYAGCRTRGAGSVMTPAMMGTQEHDSSMGGISLWALGGLAIVALASAIAAVRVGRQRSAP